MPASADEWAVDLEARLIAKQQLQFDALQKRLLLGSVAAQPEEIDQPFSEYVRNFLCDRQSDGLPLRIDGLRCVHRRSIRKRDPGHIALYHALLLDNRLWPGFC